MRKIYWYISGFKDQQAAEKQLDEMLDWARKSFDLNLWTTDAGVRTGVFGYKAEIELTEVKTNNAES